MGARATRVHGFAGCIHKLAKAIGGFGRACQVRLARIVGDVSFLFDKFVGTCSK